MRANISTEVQDALNALEQLLDDMGVNGLWVSQLAKAKARVAIEPFLDQDPEYLTHLMSLEEALRIVKECEDAR